MDETSSGALKLKMDTDVSATSGAWVGDASERPRVIDQSCTFLYSVTPNVVGAVFCQFFFSLICSFASSLHAPSVQLDHSLTNVIPDPTKEASASTHTEKRVRRP